MTSDQSLAAATAAAAVDAPVDAATPAAPLKQPPLKQPPPEKALDTRRRSFVVLSFWLVVMVLGLPIWWKTTTIYRANLPLDRMLQWAEGKVRRLVELPAFAVLPLVFGPRIAC